jgi:hypothetical protein
LWRRCVDAFQKGRTASEFRREAGAFRRREARGRSLHLRRLDQSGTPAVQILAVDFGHPQNRRSLLTHFYSHGHVELSDLIELLRGTGLSVLESGAVGIRDLQFVFASNGAPS